MHSNGQIKEVQFDFEQIVEHMLDAVLIINGSQLVYANDAARQLIPIRNLSSLNQIVLSSFFRPNDLSLLLNKVQYVQSGKSDTESLILSLFCNGETQKPIEVTITPLQNPLTELVLLTVRDISDRKAAEEGIMQSEKLSVIGELAAGIIHEVRNPLTSIKGFLQLMQNEPVVKKDYLSIVMSEVEQIEKIANELLYFTKPKKAHFITLELLPVIEETLFLFDAEAQKKQVSLNLKTDECTHLVNGDKSQLKQVLVNLVKNALEAALPGGKITIALSSAGSQEQLQVRDTGKGIPKPLLDKLGKSFFTTKESGTGLGLMVTYNIIRNHNGKITVESRENQGTTFTLRFPKADAAPS